MDLSQIASSFGVPVAVMAAMGTFLWALWKFATGPVMERVMVPLVKRHVAFLDSLDQRGATQHAQTLSILRAIAAKLGVIPEPEQEKPHA